jgi:phospholipid transport system substrate-binding protein
MIARRLFLAAMLAFAAGKASAQASSPVARIQTFNTALLGVMHAGKATPFAQRMTMLTPVVQQVFDLQTLLESSVGPAKWSGISAAQRTELLDVFTQFTVSSYVGNFDAFNGETFTVLPDTRRVGNDVVVATRLNGAGVDVTKLDYQMRDSDAGWRVVDILLDGAISRVAVTRSDFRALLAEGATPGDAAPLIASLRAKSASLAAGSTN